MSQNENSPPDSENVPVSAPAAQHKVIADLHSGMVILARVATNPDDLPEEPEDLVNSPGSGSPV